MCDSSIFSFLPIEPSELVYGCFIFCSHLVRFFSIFITHINSLKSTPILECFHILYLSLSFSLPFSICLSSTWISQSIQWVLKLSVGTQTHKYTNYISIVRNHWRASIDSDINIEIYIHFSSPPLPHSQRGSCCFGAIVYFYDVRQFSNSVWKFFAKNGLRTVHEFILSIDWPLAMAFEPTNAMHKTYSEEHEQIRKECIWYRLVRLEYSNKM